MAARTAAPRIRPTAERHFTGSVPCGRLGRPFELDAERVRVRLELRAQRLGIETEAREIVAALPVCAVGAVTEPLAHPLRGIAARGVSGVPEEAVHRPWR